ncbi:MAG: amidohydrolase family protein [Pseudomonadales bacterium]
MLAKQAKHTETTIMWAHTGRGHFVTPTEDHLDILETFLSRRKNLYFDISWDEVTQYVVKDKQSLEVWAALINRYPDRFLFGTDSVAPNNNGKYALTYKRYAKLWLEKAETHFTKLVKCS